KATWGAFFGTDLDSELKRRGIRTIVLGGVATQFGVESTARQAWELGYELVIVRDATTDLSTEGHDNTMRRVFPRIARVTGSDALAFAKPWGRNAAFHPARATAGAAMGRASMRDSDLRCGLRTDAPAGRAAARRHRGGDFPVVVRGTRE